MEQNLKKQILEKTEENRRRKKIYAGISIMAFAACIITFYMLILPAITLSKTTVCGQEEHRHNEECYGQNLICRKEETAGHQHSDSCYSVGNIKFVCSQEGHVHNSDCKNSDGKLVCGYAEGIGHQHDGACYDGNGGLVCTLPELEEHTHSKKCFGDNDTLICKKEEGRLVSHQHSTQCRVTERILSCGQEEADAHAHEESCYEKTLICQIQEHTHDNKCLVSKAEESPDNANPALPETETEKESQEETVPETEDTEEDSPVHNAQENTGSRPRRSSSVNTEKGYKYLDNEDGFEWFITSYSATAKRNGTSDYITDFSTITDNPLQPGDTVILNLHFKITAEQHIHLVTELEDGYINLFEWKLPQEFYHLIYDSYNARAMTKEQAIESLLGESNLSGKADGWMEIEDQTGLKIYVAFMENGTILCRFAGFEEQGEISGSFGLEGAISQKHTSGPVTVPLPDGTDVTVPIAEQNRLSVTKTGLRGNDPDGNECITWTITVQSSDPETSLENVTLDDSIIRNLQLIQPNSRAYIKEYYKQKDDAHLLAETQTTLPSVIGNNIISYTLAPLGDAWQADLEDMETYDTRIIEVTTPTNLSYIGTLPQGNNYYIGNKVNAQFTSSEGFEHHADASTEVTYRVEQPFQVSKSGTFEQDADTGKWYEKWRVEVRSSSSLNGAQFSDQFKSNNFNFIRTQPGDMVTVEEYTGIQNGVAVETDVLLGSTEVPCNAGNDPFFSYSFKDTAFQQGQEDIRVLYFRLELNEEYLKSLNPPEGSGYYTLTNYGTVTHNGRSVTGEGSVRYTYTMLDKSAGLNVTEENAADMGYADTSDWDFEKYVYQKYTVIVNTSRLPLPTGTVLTDTLPRGVFYTDGTLLLEEKEEDVWVPCGDSRYTVHTETSDTGKTANNYKGETVTYYPELIKTTLSQGTYKTLRLTYVTKYDKNDTTGVGNYYEQIVDGVVRKMFELDNMIGISGFRVTGGSVTQQAYTGIAGALSAGKTMSTVYGTQLEELLEEYHVPDAEKGNVSQCVIALGGEGGIYNHVGGFGFTDVMKVAEDVETEASAGTAGYMHYVDNTFTFRGKNRAGYEIVLHLESGKENDSVVYHPVLDSVTDSAHNPVTGDAAQQQAESFLNWNWQFSYDAETSTIICRLPETIVGISYVSYLGRLDKNSEEGLVLDSGNEAAQGSSTIFNTATVTTGDIQESSTAVNYWNKSPRIQKTGAFDWNTKQFTWQVDYNYESPAYMRQPVLTDILPEKEKILSVQVQKGTAGGDENTFEYGDAKTVLSRQAVDMLVEEDPAGAAANQWCYEYDKTSNTLTLMLYDRSEDAYIVEPYRFLIKTDFSDSEALVIGKGETTDFSEENTLNYHTETFLSEPTAEHTVSFEVPKAVDKRYVSFESENAVASWKILINGAGVKNLLAGSVLTDTMSSGNMSVNVNSIKIHKAEISYSPDGSEIIGHTEGELLEIDKDYTVTSNGSTFRIRFNFEKDTPEAGSAYWLSYDTKVSMTANNALVNNTASLSVSGGTKEIEDTVGQTVVVQGTIVGTNVTLKLYKSDTDGRLVSGAVFQLAEYNEHDELRVIETKETDGNSELQFERPMLPSQTYYLFESIVPDGYYQFGDSSSGLPQHYDADILAALAAEGRLRIITIPEQAREVIGNVWAASMTNVPREVKLQKTNDNGENPVFLPGAEFELYQVTAKGDVRMEPSAFRQIPFTEEIDVNGSFYYWYDPAAQSDNQAFVTNDRGILDVRGLPAGSYYFKEINPPENYYITEEQEEQKYHFTLDEVLSKDSIAITAEDNTVTLLPQVTDVGSVPNSRINAVDVQLQVHKILKDQHGNRLPLQENEFSFNLYSVTMNEGKEENEQKLEESACGTSGIIRFGAITLDKEGTYYYSIREKKTQSTTITYDSGHVLVKVEVSRDLQDRSKYHADITYTYYDKQGNAVMRTEEIDGETPQNVFINSEKVYELPETGGTGTAPWLLTGTGILLAGIWLSLRYCAQSRRGAAGKKK